MGGIDVRIGEETRMNRFSNIFNLLDMFDEDVLRRCCTDHGFIIFDPSILNQFLSMLFDCCCQTESLVK